MLTKLRMTDSSCSPKFQLGFTLVELLVVISILSLLSAVSYNSFCGAIKGSAANRAESDLLAIFESARTYAMAHRTYTRIAITQSNTPTNDPTLIVLSLYSTSGFQTTNPADVSSWPMFCKPLMVPGFAVNDALNSTKVDTTHDALPSQSDIGSLDRTTNGHGRLSFASFVDFNPSGEAGTRIANPDRYIKLALDQVSPRNSANPIILRISGINGTITVLRKEDL